MTETNVLNFPQDKVVKYPVACPLCGSSEWVNVDEYRLKAEGMCLCLKCGFITYPEIVLKSEELKEFYRKEYRPGPTVQNLFTGQRKLHYHAHFLKDLFDQWKKEKRNLPEVFEVGAAFGLFLNWVREQIPKAKLSGSELTLSMRRVAYWHHDVNLTEDFDDSKKYDLIASYKCLEHIPFPEKELRRYALALKDEGFLYVSVPTWFHSMTNFGLDGFSPDVYYDKNHVNVWTRKLFETLLKKCGLEVVKADYVYYDSTYLCRRNDELMKEEPQYEASAEVIDLLSRVKKAWLNFDMGLFDEALACFPAYPDAQIATYEKNRQAWDKKGWEEIEKGVINRAREVLPNSQKIVFFCADLCMRYGRWEQALDLLGISQKMRPGDAHTIIAAGQCYRNLAQATTDPKKRIQWLSQSIELMKHLQQISLQHQHEGFTWMFTDQSNIPMPGEEDEKSA